jgi:hypothetical protein
LIPIAFRLLKRRCDEVMVAVDERHTATISRPVTKSRLAKRPTPLY